MCPALLHKCLAWLKKEDPQPERCMYVGERRLSETETHAGWCAQLQNQSVWDGQVDEDLAARTKRCRVSYVAQARAKRGRGGSDRPVLQPEVDRLVQGWDDSGTIPSDLVPRAPCKCGALKWDKLLWQLMRLLGPGGLAVRPYLWRLAAMVALFKKGNAAAIPSFRLIMVESQLGLLQEGLLLRRDSYRLTWPRRSTGT